MTTAPVHASRMSSLSLSAAVKAAIKPKPACSTTYEALRTLWGLYWDARTNEMSLFPLIVAETRDSLRIKAAIVEVIKAM